MYRPIITRKVAQYLFLLSSLFIFQSCNNPLGKSSGQASNSSPQNTDSTSTSKNSISLFAANLVGAVNLVPPALFNGAAGLVLDSEGNIYVADKDNNKIRKITSSGQVSTFAGSGLAGFTDGAGLAASFNYPTGITIDSAGNLYVADTLNQAIRKITSAGVVSTYAKSGGVIPVLNTSLNYPIGLVFDSNRNLYVADEATFSIIKITPAGVSTVYASNNGGFYVDELPPKGIAIDANDTIYVTYQDQGADGRRIYSMTQAGIVTRLAFPLPANFSEFTSVSGITVDNKENVYAITDNNIVLITKSGNASIFASGLTGNGIALDAAGNIYISNNSTIRRIAAQGIPPLGGNVTTLAGVAGKTGSSDNSGPDSQVAHFNFSNFTGDLTTDSVGNIYVADTNNFAVRKITPAGEVNTVAAATSFNSRYLNSITIDSSGTMYVSASNDAIYSVTPSGLVTLIAGGGNGFADGIGASAQFQSINGIVMDSLNNIYVSDSGNSAIRKITPSGVVTTLAGPASFGGSPAPTIIVPGMAPSKIAIDSSDSLYIATNYTIQKITDPNNINGLLGISTYAGTGGLGYANDSAVPTNAQFGSINGIALDPEGNVYVADTENYAIRKINRTTGEVTTFAGAGAPGTQDLVDGTGTAARFKEPVGLTYSTSDKCLYVTDYGTIIRKITIPGAVVTTVSGAAGVTGSTDTIYPTARFLTQGGMVKASDGGLYVVDTFNHKILKVSADGKTILNVAGQSGVSGNADGVGTAATFRYPQGIIMDSTGILYVTDTFNHILRKIVVDPTTHLGTVTTFAGGTGLNDFRDDKGTLARFNYPQGITIDRLGNLYVADGYNHRIRKITMPEAAVTTVTGQAASGYQDGSASTALFSYMKNFLFDSNNNAYLLDSGNNVIRKISNFGESSADVGTMLNLTSVNNSSSSITHKYSSNISLGNDSKGNVYISDFDKSLIQKIDANKGGITTVAGTAGKAAYAVETALPGTLLNPSSIYVDPSGTYLYVLENNNLIKVTLSIN